MASSAFRRDLSAEAARHSRGRTPEERIAEALRMGETCLDVFLAALPPGTTREEARARAGRLKGRGRRGSDSSLS
ncbi:MAG: hypothetical protein U0529_05695 [Thermoanaerobaculia bacterium]